MTFREAKDHAESRNLLFACARTDLQAEQTATRRENSMSLKLPAHRAFDALTSRAPAGVSLIGTHKNLQPCRLPNLFSYQTSSSLNQLSAVDFQLSAKSKATNWFNYPPKRSWILLRANS